MFLYLLMSKAISVLVPYCSPKNIFLFKIFMGFWGSLLAQKLFKLRHPHLVLWYKTNNKAFR